MRRPGDLTAAQARRDAQNAREWAREERMHPRECQIGHHGCSETPFWRVRTHTGETFVICHELWISMHESLGDPYVTATYERIGRWGQG